MPIFKCSIGSDPELLVRDKDGNCLDASDFIRPSGAFGCDGCSSTGELRPAPAMDGGVMTFVNNVMALIRAGRDEWQENDLPPHQWVAGHGVNRRPIGGHIHIGSAERFRPTTSRQRDEVFYNFIKMFSILRRELEDSASARMRTDMGYGKFDSSCIRQQAWGFEFRSPPSWLVMPEVAAAYASVAKLAYQAGRNKQRAKVRSINGMRDFACRMIGNEMAEGDVLVGINLLPKLKGRINWMQDIKEMW